MLEMRIERECLGEAPLSHREEGHGVNEAQLTLTPLEQQIEAGLVERFVNPDYLEERCEVRPKAPDCVQAQPAADEGVRLHENERCRHERSLPRPKGGEHTRRARVVLVRPAEQRQETGGVGEDATHVKGSSR